jgi:hypothetical protein
LLPYQQGGTVRYDADKQRWKQSGGNFFLKAFGGEGLGRPEREMKFTLDDAKNFLKRAEIDLGTHSPEVILVFTNSSVNLHAEESEFPAITAAKLKEFIRKKAKTSTLADETQKKIESSIQV